MIWYFLSPFRGTAEPPILPTSHPLRKLLSQYGTTVSRRPALFVALSAAVAATVCYLFIVLYAIDPATCALGCPRRVWYSTPVNEPSGSLPDVVVKQTWIFGDYMRALDRELLGEAISIQETLLGPMVYSFPKDSSSPLVHGSADFHWDPKDSERGPSPPQMIFHSPLMYWNCSSETLKADPDVVGTVNRLSRMRSPFNVPLRLSSVLERASFDGSDIISADALIISLLFQRGSKAEDTWNQGSKSLAADGRYTVLPRDDGTVAKNYYTFRYHPVKYWDFLPPAIAFALTAAYLFWGIRNVRSVRSRTVIAAVSVAQISVSTMMAFVIVMFQEPGLSRIPLVAYYCVSFVIGFENTFRFTNAVLETPLEQSSAYRISKTLGDVGYLPLVAAGENLSVLWVLSYRFPHIPHITAFYRLTATALLCDLIMHGTFFLAILSLGLQRLELGSSINDKSFRSTNRTTPERPRRTGGLALEEVTQKTWKPDSELYRPVLRMRTIATVLIICTVSALNWNNATQDPLAGLTQLPGKFIHAMNIPTGAVDSCTIIAPFPMPKTQDIETIIEGVPALGLHGRNYIAEIYEPLIVVINDSKRPGQKYYGKRLLPSAGLRIIGRHYQRILLYATLTAAVAGLLVHYLNHNKGQDEIASSVETKSSQIKIITLGPVHDMDILMLTGSAKGVIASVGLDRQIRVWRLKGHVSCESINALPPEDHRSLWPVAAIAIDDQAEWLAILPRAGDVTFWNINTSRFGTSVPINDRGSELAHISFTPKNRDSNRPSNASLIMVSKRGLLTEVEIGKSEAIDHRITNDSVNSCQPLHSSRLPLRLVCLTRDDTIQVSMKRGKMWVTQKIQLPIPLRASLRDIEFLPVSELGMLGLVKSLNSPDAYLVDLQLSAVIWHFRLNIPRARTLRIFHSPRQPCRSCGASAVASFSIAYKMEDTEGFVMHTFTPNRTQQERGYLICVRTERNPREKRCAGFEQVIQNVYRSEMTGVWEATHFNSVAGIREGPRKYSAARKAKRALASRGLLRRKSNDLQQERNSDLTPEEENWEAWAMFSTGEVITYPMPEVGDPEETSLLVTRVGPACAVGRKSVAVAFGNAIKMVLLGNELHEDIDNDDDLNRNVRRRPLVRKQNSRIM